MNIYEPCTRNNPAVFLIPQTRTVKYILFSSTQIDVLFSLIWCGTQMNVPLYSATFQNKSRTNREKNTFVFK